MGTWMLREINARLRVMEPLLLKNVVKLLSVLSLHMGLLVLGTTLLLEHWVPTLLLPSSATIVVVTSELLLLPKVLLLPLFGVMPKILTRPQLPQSNNLLTQSQLISAAVRLRAKLLLVFVELLLSL